LACEEDQVSLSDEAFHAAYPGRCQCNLRPHRRSHESERLLERLLAIPAFCAAFNLDYIKHGYYSIERLQPDPHRPARPEPTCATRRG
jgi:hypothetical protein